jgi:hypothetical protein
MLELLARWAEFYPGARAVVVLVTVSLTCGPVAAAWTLLRLERLEFAFGRRAVVRRVVLGCGACCVFAPAIVGAVVVAATTSSRSLAPWFWTTAAIMLVLQGAVALSVWREWSLTATVWPNVNVNLESVRNGVPVVDWESATNVDNAQTEAALLVSVQEV